MQEMPLHFVGRMKIDGRYYGRFVGASSCCSAATALRIVARDAGRLRLPMPSPPPKPTSNARMPTTMGTQRGVPPVPEVLAGGGVVWPVAGAGVGVAVTPDFTVKTKAP